jgi:hypothetical protein
MLVLLALYPIVSLEIAYLMAHLAGLRPAFASFVGNVISVSLVAYVAMPLLVRAMGWWLFPKPDNARNVTLAGTRADRGAVRHRDRALLEDPLTRRSGRRSTQVTNPGARRASLCPANGRICDRA